MIIGQEKICNLVDNSTIDTFPQTLMLVGNEGSGKHLICNYIAKKFNLTILDITDTLDQETIELIYDRVEPYIYTININSISVKEENAILKFLEEPLRNSYIILLAETELGILQTIINRCQIWYLQNYKKEFLQTFITNDNQYVLEIAETPGQVIKLCDCKLEDMISLADKIIDKIDIAGIANTLTISKNISFKDESDKFDLKLFVNILLSRITKKYQTCSDNRYASAYLLTNELSKNLRSKNLDHRCLFEKYLIDLRNIMRGNLL